MNAAVHAAHVYARVRAAEPTACPELVAWLTVKAALKGCHSDADVAAAVTAVVAAELRLNAEAVPA